MGLVLGLAACDPGPVVTPDAGIPDAGVQVGRVEGRVQLEGASSHEGVTVTLEGTELSTTTTEEGAFHLESVPVGTYSLWAHKAGYAKASRSVVVEEDKASEVPLTLEKVRGQLVGTLVLEGASSHEGIAVTLSAGPEWSVTTTTAPDGRFQLNRVPVGAYVLSAQKAGYDQASRSVVVEEDATTEASFSLSRSAPPVLSQPPVVVTQGGRLVLRGSGFGEQRGVSTVSVGGVPVEEFVSWTDSEVVVQVPSTVSPGVRGAEVSLGFPWRTASFSLQVHAQVTLSSASRWSVGIKPDGTVTVWGYGDFITPPAGLTEVVTVSANYRSAIALKKDGTVVVWGSNVYGQNTVPPGLSEVAAVYAGYSHHLALKQDGTLVAWGEDSALPASLPRVVNLAVGDSHHLAIDPEGAMVGWGGYNVFGERNIPGGLTGVVALAAGGKHSMVLKQDGTLVVWGANDAEQGRIPPGLTNVAAIALAYERNLVLKRDGTVVAWGGYNVYGESNVPAGLSGVVAISAGERHSAVLKQDGTVVVWGSVVPPPEGLVLKVPGP